VQYYADHTRGYYWGIGGVDKINYLAKKLYDNKLKDAHIEQAKRSVKAEYEAQIKRLRG